ncbi:MAG: hypothetical protein ACI8ZM_000392 [Crocinitomix sp.]|jgi:hypothetical protein
MRTVFVMTFFFSFMFLFGQVTQPEMIITALNLTGDVKSVNIQTLDLKKSTKRKWQIRKYGIDTVITRFYSFDESDLLNEVSDTVLPERNQYYFQNLKAQDYKIRFDSLKGYEIAERIVLDTNEFELRYRTFNEQGLLLKDSSRIRGYFEPHYFEGPIVWKYRYDVYGNLRVSWFKSSYVFALIGSSSYAYVYDAHGNWIEKREYSVGPIRSGDMDFYVNLRKEKFHTITYREIVYN